MSLRRCAIVSVVLLASWGARHQLGKPAQVITPAALTAFPRQLDAWSGRDVTIPGDLLQQTGVDDHLFRVYESGGRSESLWVGYYRSQRQGAAIHSPMNCLPGNGWQPVTTERLALPLAGAAAAPIVNKVVVRKGLERQLVLYWYQTSDRVTASEYWSKAYLVADAVRSGRTDIALVRIVSPLDPTDPDAEAKALQYSLPFAGRVLPSIRTQLFPS
jgi:EpsI family protein